MDTSSLSRARWRKSTCSNGQNACVEVADLDSGMAIRDSKNPHGAVLLFTDAEWAAFVEGVRDGAFDLS